MDEQPNAERLIGSLINMSNKDRIKRTHQDMLNIAMAIIDISYSHKKDPNEIAKQLVEVYDYIVGKTKEK